MYQDSTPAPAEEEGEEEDSDLEISDNESDDEDDDEPVQYTYTAVTEKVPVLAPTAPLYPTPAYVSPPPVTYYYHSYYPASAYYARYPFRYPLRCSGASYYYCYPYVRQ